MSRRSRRGIAVTTMVAALIVGMVSAASARIIERERYAFEYSFEDEICGFDVLIEGETSGLFTIRTSHDDRAFFGADVFRYREVVTNLDNGRQVVVHGKGNFRELHATHVEGDIFLFRAHVSGQPFVIETIDGKVVYRERGLLVFEALFDTGGDDVPGGELLSEELISVRGHPGFLEEDDFCLLVDQLLGD